MSEVLAVLLDDAVAGSVTRLADGRLQFDYEDSYRVSTEATPLSVSMPLSVRSHPDRVISPWLSGLLPDNELVLERWSREFQTAAKPFSLLGTPIGHDCAGAVRFAGVEETLQVLGAPGSVQWLTEQEVAQRLRELREDSTAWLGRGFTGQFSLAGAQAKTALLFDEGRWGVPSGAAATSHILKPAVSGLEDHDLNEHLCLDAARRAGLVVARTRLARFAEESAIVVTRYDRRAQDGEIIRVHQEDICQALSVRPERKYQDRGGPGPADVAGLLRNVIAPLAAEEAVWRFFDALIWNWLIGGTDAHAKNYSLLLSGGEVRLAPLYDVASALPYADTDHELRLAMKLGGDYRMHPNHDRWRKAAEEVGLESERAIARVVALADITPDAFSDAANALEVVELERPLPTRLVDLVAERTRQCLAIIPAATKHRARRDARYEQALRELLEDAFSQPLSSEDGRRLIGDASAALREAVRAKPRELSLVKERIIDIGTDAFRVLNALTDETVPEDARPARERVRAQTDRFAPNLVNLQIATDDPVARVSDEILNAARSYVSADEQSIFGAPAERLRLLYRVAGLAGRALTL